MRYLADFAGLIGAAVIAIYATGTAGQTYSECNPLTSGDCPADPALGKSVSIDFTSGASSAFTASGSPIYNSNGVAFTVAKPGDSPQIISKWYLMFGHVDYVIQAAPGAGIVSSAVLQSDCLDEIDWEWLGGDDTKVQSNYFGKGITTSYNRGAFHADPENQGGFKKYSIDWTNEQIVWQVDGVTVRVLTQSDAATGQYPSTPMLIKVGAWSGGDSSNSPGTIQWAGGPTNYAAGPYTMYLRSIVATDYSTGTQYSYSGTSGTWQSIESYGGTISGNDGSSTPSSSAIAPSVTSSSSNTAPMPFQGHGASTSTYVTPSIWPWVGTASTSAATALSSGITTSISGLPSGWIITSSGKVQPPSSASVAITPVSLLLSPLLIGSFLILGF